MTSDEVACSWCGRIATARIVPHREGMPLALYYFDRRPSPEWTVTLEDQPRYLCSDRCSYDAGSAALADLIASGQPIPPHIRLEILRRETKKT